MWPDGGDPTSSDPSKRAPLCVIVEFDDANLDDPQRAADGSDTVVSRRFFNEASGLSKKCVPIYRVEGESKVDPNVKRQQFPLTLAWALTYWKAQG